ncbi:hypothetical protein B0J13DRAFT_195513 [Dactylonectria estremocensis]|uniref:Uncharacterized protein n=1 Tax=Dactylonectria estremocensis TaxID=1079267 RepID=A0A9P9DHX1_9HYPO|nr:hypothetical protein B0J13DRAFT_195513 [Dactylonectria estremocensis]
MPSVPSFSDLAMEDVIPLYRRSHFESTCRYVDAHRHDYPDIPIDQLIAVAFHTTPRILGSCAVKKLVESAVRCYQAEEKSNLFHDWQRYCKALTGTAQAITTFEGAIHFGSHILPASAGREFWIASCNASLRQLKMYSAISKDINVEPVVGKKRKATTQGSRTATVAAAEDAATDLPAGAPLTLPFLSIAQATDRQFFAEMPKVDRLEIVLGGILFAAVLASDRRKQEEQNGIITLTSTAVLYPAVQEDGDFIIGLWLCRSMGRVIAEAMMNSVDSLRIILGNHLFEGMKASNLMREEEKMGMARTNAINVSYPNGEKEDCKVEITINFWAGNHDLGVLFPTEL